MTSSSQKLLTRAVIVIIILVVAVFAFQKYRPSQVYSTFKSPAGDYTLVVHQYSRFFAVPGDGGSGPGYVELFDKDGARIARSNVPSVLDFSQQENIHWSAHTVVVPGMLDLTF